MTQISEHFTITEAEYSSTALRLGIDNIIPKSKLYNVKMTSIMLLEPVRKNFGVPFSPNSFFRNEELEKAICWNNKLTSSFAKWCKRHNLPINNCSWKIYFKKKQHPTGNAVDFVIPRIPILEVAKWIKNNLKFDQLILEYYNPKKRLGWIHASFNIEKNRQQTLTIGINGIKNGLP